MNNSIIDYISQFIELTKEEATIVNEQNLFRQYRKNDILLAEGNYATECYFIIKGCVRSYYTKDGEERNTDFFFENQTIRPVSYLTKQSSQYYLSCLEESWIAVGNEARNQQLVEKIPKLSSLITQMGEVLLIQKTLELDHFKNNTPEERYKSLVENQPELLSRIPLFHLASYLGITQVSLSRMRRRIMVK